MKTLKEIAKHLNLNPAILYRERQKDHYSSNPTPPPKNRIGNILLWDDQDLTEWEKWQINRPGTGNWHKNNH